LTVRTCVSFVTQARSPESILIALSRPFERAGFTVAKIQGATLEVTRADARMFLLCERSEDRWVIFAVPPAEGLVSLGLVIETDLLRSVVATLQAALTASRMVESVSWHLEKDWDAGHRSSGVGQP
jgi:hypothetical protein